MGDSYDGGIQTEPQSDVQPDSSQGDATAQEPQDVSQTGTQPPEDLPPFHEHPRWQQVQAELKAYKQLGDPATLQAHLNQLAQYEQRVLREWQANQQPKPTPTAQPQYSQEETAARQYLMKLLPELAQVEELRTQAQGFQQNVVAQQEATVSRGQTAIASFVQEKLGKQSNLATIAIENAVTAVIAQNPTAHARFRAGDVSMVDWALGQLDTELFGAVKRGAVASYTQGKQKVTNLPATSAAANRGTPGRTGGATEDADTSDARADKGFAILERFKKQGR